MKIAIVGGGISGVVTALALADSGNEIKILEKDQYIGGILRDHDIVGKGVWYRNCQYLDPSDFWTQSFIDQSQSAWNVFPHHYGSWNDLYGLAHASYEFAQIAVPFGKAEPIRGGSAFGSLHHRLSQYPERIGSPIKAWAQRWGDLNAMSPDNCDFLQIGRVFVESDLEGTLQRKEESGLADALYGVPLSKRLPPLSPEEGAVPRAGWNAVFDGVDRLLRSKGIELLLRAPAKPVLQENKLRIMSRGESISSDLIIWCANPNPLIHALGWGRIDSPCSKMLNVLFQATGTAPKNPSYWQIFSQTSSVVRLFSYWLQGHLRLTVEAFDDGSDVSEISRDVRRLSHECGYEISIEHVATVPDRRFALLTNSDREIFEKVDRTAASVGLISGGWHHYGRTRRLQHIFERLHAQGVFLNLR